MGGDVDVERCEFRNNVSDYGAALLASHSTRIVDSTFSGNEANVSGGAIYASSSTHSPITVQEITDCSFSNNVAAESGGAVYLNGVNLSAPSLRAVLERCRVEGNTASTSGSGIHVNGSLSSGQDAVALVNCLVAGNTGAEALHARLWNPSNQLLIQNCTIVDNQGGCTFDLSASVSNSILWNNGFSIDGPAFARYSNVENGWYGESVCQRDPRLASDYTLASDSPMIDNGSLALIPGVR